MSPVVVTPLTSTIGARVEGVDLHRGWTPTEIDQIHQALLDHLVLVIPGQDMTAERQREFAATFGPPQPYPVAHFFGDDETIINVDNQLIAPPPPPDDRETGSLSDAEGWHSDYTFNREIPAVATLRAEILPTSGGDTFWSNMYEAYEALSPVMRGILDGLSAVHWSGPLFATNYGLDRFGPDAVERFDEAFPPSRHPVVLVHPETGRRALFVNPAYTTHIVGMTRSESRNLLQYLFRHVTTPNFLYRHHWSLDDLVIWDERATVHLAPTDFQPQRRRLVRVAAGSTAPGEHRVGAP